MMGSTGPVAHWCCCRMRRKVPRTSMFDEFNLDEGGTLMVELTPEDDDVPGVEADTSNLNGRIFALYNPGFYDD